MEILNEWGLLGSIGAAMFLGFFIQRITGFGSAMIAIPIISMSWNPHAAINLLLIFQALFGFVLLGKTWYSLKERKIRYFALFFFPLTMSGMYVLPSLPERAITLTVGIVLTSVVIQQLLKPHFEIPARYRNGFAGFFGTLSGAVQGTFGMGGPFFLAYFGNVEKRSQLIRDTSIALFSIANISRLPVSLATAQIDERILIVAATSLLPFGLAIWLGNILTHKISEKMFRTILLIILSISAARMLWG